MNSQIKEITNVAEKSKYAKEILDKLPEWFGNEKSKNEYIIKVKQLPFWASINEEGRCVGFFAITIHYNCTGDITVCGIDPDNQRNGIGSALYRKVEDYLIKKKCKYIIVKTLSELADYEPYERTRMFYKKMGFSELVTLTEMWDEENPCLIMIKQVGKNI